MSAFRIKAFEVNVVGYATGTVFAASRGRALAETWRCDAFNAISFGDFLKIARVRRDPIVSPRFGEAMMVCGKPAFYVEHNRAYIRFAYADSDRIGNAHPYDVEPPEARRGTPYYVAPTLSRLAGAA